MKKNFLCFIVSGMIFIFGCSNDDDNGTNPSNDTQAPSVTITSPASGYSTSGITTITVEATDNEAVSKVELLVDGSVISTDTNSPYSFEIDFSSFSEGAHSVVAKAYDTNDNIAISEAITINSLWDFWPSGNGAIQVTITHYEEEAGAVLDGFGCGDPYFFIAFYPISGGTSENRIPTSGYWEDYCELDNIGGFKYDVEDSLHEFIVGVLVMDYDFPSADDTVDCNPIASSKPLAILFNTKEDTFPFIRSYNGEDDGNSGEDDCEITIKVELIERNWTTKNNFCGF